MRRILEQLYSRPWFATPGLYHSVEQIVKAKLENHQVRAAAMQDELDDFFVQRAPLTVEPGGLAVIDISGVLGNKLSNIEKACGATDYADISGDIGQAKKLGASGYIFTIDSGGGMANGCAETANLIASIEAPKIAYVESMACSAAYFLASACDSIVAGPSATLGSIGVILPWIDSSVLWNLSGISFQPITNEGAALKSAGYGPSLTEAQRAHLQQYANDIGLGFQDFVKEHRPEISDEVFAAGAYVAPRALTLGLADDIGDMSVARSRVLQSVDTRQKSKFSITMPDNPTPTPTPTPTQTVDQLVVKAFEENEQIRLLEEANRLLTLRCDSMEAKIALLSKTVQSLPSAENIRETVNARFVEAEAARGHAAPLVHKANDQADLAPKERARQRVRENPSVLKFINREQ